jgi:serine/threonine protein kinase
MPVARAGERIGVYTLQEQLGSGGFGVVWRAARTEPFRQEVAIKLLRAGLDTPTAVARFEQERQTLALMDHPNIAKVLDGGVTPDGRTFVVMELVKGEPLHQFCDRNKLSIRRRLQLFALVCDAIQHAHMRGVIHRDIKPSNILASVSDDPALGGGTGMSVKVIDFGIAKGVSPATAAKEVFTRVGELIGTPEYMSPEQADGGADIDTRADVYSLGVVLYELLAGAPPFDPRSLRSAGFAEINRIIREVEPPKPSDRLTTLAEASTDTAAADRVAQERSTTRVALAQTLRQEIEWVPMKAMRKDRGERYRSAMELADDVRNYLDGRALLAGPPSVAYRARKFVRRHRVAVGAAAAVAVALLFASVVSTWFGVAEARARRLAEQRERQVREVARFQQDMLAGLDPELAGRKLLRSLAERFDEAQRIAGVQAPQRDAESIAMRDYLRRVNATDAARDFLKQVVLEPAADAATKGFREDPRVRASLQQTLAENFLLLGLPRDAAPLQDEALRTRTEQFGADDRDTLASLAWSGRVKMALGELKEAATRLEQALEARRRLFGERDPDTVDSLQGLAKLKAKSDQDRPEATELFRLLTDPSGPAPADVRLQNAPGAAEMLLRAGAPAKAMDLLLAQREAASAGRDRDPRTAILVLNNLGQAERSVDPPRLDEAEASYRKALEISESALGDEHSLSFLVRSNLAMLLTDRGRAPEAEALYRKGVEIGRRALPPNHEELLRTLNNCGQLMASQGKLDQAEALVGEAERGSALLRSHGDRDALEYVASMAGILEKRGNLGEAEKRRREVLAAYRKTLPAEDMLVLDSARELGRLLTDMRRYGDAVDVLAPAVEDATKRPLESNARWYIALQLRDTLKAWQQAEPTGPAGSRLPAAQTRIDELIEPRTKARLSVEQKVQ